MYPPVLTKADFVRRFMDNEFGNRGPVWNNWLEYSIANLGASKSTLYHIRNRIAGGPTWYNVPRWQMADQWLVACNMVPQEQLYIAEMAPTELTLIQGEVYQRATTDINQCGLYLNYSLVKKPMRDALKEQSLEAQGLLASQILQHYMDRASWEWLNELFLRYDGHVVEFSCYSKFWGTVSRRNTVIWEVRGGY